MLPVTQAGRGGCLPQDDQLILETGRIVRRTGLDMVPKGNGAATRFPLHATIEESLSILGIASVSDCQTNR